jgi:hypothetical protein
MHHTETTRTAEKVEEDRKRTLIECVNENGLIRRYKHFTRSTKDTGVDQQATLLWDEAR